MMVRAFADGPNPSEWVMRWPSVVCGSLAVLAGCEQSLAPGVTYHKVTALNPIFYVEKLEGVDDDGTKWKTEKGDAVCWLNTWEKEHRYDKEGFLIYRKERDSSLWGLFSEEVEETEEFKTKRGNFLIWPYQSRRLKTAAEK